MNAFITGSRAYGTPTEDSDIDLVVRCDPKAAKILRAMTDAQNGTTRYGKLNLIVCESDTAYAVWRLGTSQLQLMQPVGREKATDAFNKIRELVGIEDEGDSRLDSRLC